MPQLGGEIVHLRFVALAMENGERRVSGDGVCKPLPVAAVTGDPDRAFRLRKVFEAFERGGASESLSVKIRQPENLRKRFAEVMEHGPDGSEAPVARPVRERGSDVCDG